MARQGTVEVPGRLRVVPAFPSRAEAELRLDRNRLIEVGLWAVAILWSLQELGYSVTAVLASLGLGWVGEPVIAHRIAPLLGLLGITDPATVASI